MRTCEGLIILLILPWSSLSQRYWSCDQDCPFDCTAKADAGKPVCSYIPDVTMLPVSFVTKCHFECANKCYMNSLTINNEGDCKEEVESSPEVTKESAGSKTKRIKRLISRNAELRFRRKSFINSFSGNKWR